MASERIDRINYLSGAKIEAVTKRGTVHYQIAQTVLRDDGKVFRLAEKVSPQVVETAIKLATQRFGKELAINGTDTFCQQVVTVAAEKKLNITITNNPAMEEARKALVLKLHSPKVISADEAAELYIQERNEKRTQGITDIPNHRRYAENDPTNLPFAGLRHVEGKTLMLLQTEKKMLVLPISNDDALEAKQHRIGDTIEVNAQGIVHTHSRKM